MTNWMKSLAIQHRQACTEYPDKQLLIIFDIDGSILDMRHMILRVLQAYDHKHETNYFKGLEQFKINVHENQIDKLLTELKVPKKVQKDIHDWYQAERWTADAIIEMHRPFEGVLNIIRWFQIQPNTSVGLVTGRPESLRKDTLISLNQLGKPYRVEFTSELLFMNQGKWEEDVANVKVAGVTHFNEAGYHVFAFVDNEPSNLKALAKADLDKNLLLLHANTIYESIRTRVPAGTVRGKDYRLSELIPSEEMLPSHVQLAWHGVNDETNLRQFLSSDVQWMEVDLRLEPGKYHIILRHDSLEETPQASDEETLILDEVLSQVNLASRGIKLDFKEGEILLNLVIEMLTKQKISDKNLWFNADIDVLLEQGFRKLAKAHPKSIIQCPIDFLTPLILATPEKAHETLQMLAGWGINRFSISWEQEKLRAIFNQMDIWGYEVNIYNVPDLESFLEAVYLLPRSVTSDFNFPQWHYYGRGPGKKGNHYAYIGQKNKKGNI